MWKEDRCQICGESSSLIGCSTYHMLSNLKCLLPLGKRLLMIVGDALNLYADYDKLSFMWISVPSTTFICTNGKDFRFFTVPGNLHLFIPIIMESTTFVCVPIFWGDKPLCSFFIFFYLRSLGQCTHFFEPYSF